MPLFRKKPAITEAHPWFKNGDHPDDYAKPIHSTECGHPIIYSPQHQRINDWEGQVVRRHRTPDEPSATGCRHCGRDMHDHGWVDTLEGGHIVCPGDWVITGVAGEHYPCKPDIFEATYDLVEE
ncbi:MAG: hypothetical protein KA203_01830 [Aquabacterium sp.]|nr:hypothetical protein [Aquabacterium sp.]